MINLIKNYLLHKQNNKTGRANKTEINKMQLRLQNLKLNNPTHYCKEIGKNYKWT